LPGGFQLFVTADLSLCNFRIEAVASIAELKGKEFLNKRHFCAAIMNCRTPDVLRS
jgi:hypothetical protein